MVLRQAGPDVYDQWVNHEIPFNDPQITEAMQTVVDLWSEDNVYASGGSIAATAFQDNGQPLLDGDCWMHRQANFFAGLFPEGTTFADGEEGSVDVFYFPDINGDKPVLTAGTFAAGFNDDPATMAVLAYMATGEYASKRQAAQTAELGGALSGFLSAAQNQDPDVYQPLEQKFLEILTTSEIARFDASDLMPAVVGAGTFWTEGVSLVNGDITVAGSGRQHRGLLADLIGCGWISRPERELIDSSRHSGRGTGTTVSVPRRFSWSRWQGGTWRRSNSSLGSRTGPARPSPTRWDNRPTPHVTAS